jgi:signal transduction histidine kinase/ActR/RegA family two-component response regulator
MRRALNCADLSARMTAPPDTPLEPTPQTLAEALVALRAAEDRIRALEHRLALVQEFSQTGVFERDATTLAGHWDAQMYRIWGLPPRAPGAPAPSYDETSGMIFNEDRRTGAFSASLAEPGPHVQRVRIRRPDGAVRHLHTQWRVFHDADGRPLRVLGTNTDDTEVFELAQRNEVLRSELEVALALGGVALWRADLATGGVHFDERGAAIAGVPFGPDGVDAEAARAGLHPEDLGKVEASAAHTLRTGEPSDMELRYLMPGGGWRHVLSRRALRRDAEGRPVGFVGVLLDVSERVAENRRALESARRLEAAAEAARIGLWSSRLDTPLPSWNQRMFLLFGLDPAQGPLALDDWLANCVHADDRARVRTEVVSWWRRGQGDHAIEFRVVRPSDGALRWLVVRGSIDASGPAAARRAEGVAIDITEQQQTLRQLRATVERMQLTTRALGLGTWTASRGHAEVIWDEQMFRLRGIDSPTRRIFNDEIASFVHPEDRVPIMSDQMARAAETSLWRHSFRVCWPDGQVRWINSQSVGVFDENGQPDGRIGLNWDSTEAQLAATAMRDREVAVAESQAKSQAMSRISHELRTPLNAMLGFTQLLREAGPEVDPAQRALWLEHVEDAGVHLLALIDDVLELTRAEIGELRLASQPVACAEVVQAALRLVSGRAAQQGITLRSESQEGVVLADPVRLRQVLINLLSNAIKYNRPGGQVRVWAECRAQRVALHVADNGLGIAPERLAHAFEPFNRLGAESSGVEGSGIGLAIVKMLVQGMGGEIEAHSQPGQGSEFVVWLPAAPAGAAVAPLVETVQPMVPQPASRSRPGAARVLYIEDNPVNALLVREMLSHRPQVALTVAEDGASGLQQARAWRPDLILLDMHLPDTDGHSVHRALRSDARTAAIRCVALSANATPGDVEAARAAGFVEYWTKPIDFGRFLEGIDRLLADGG